MAWIESHTVLARHRKVLFLAHELGVDVVQIVGHLHIFWHVVLEQQEDGDLSTWPVEMIANAAGWKGDAERFVSAMQTHKWLDGRLVHDWLDYVGKFLHAKYSTSNKEKLAQIYKTHGYNYGKGEGKFKKVKAQSKRKVSAVLNQPLTNLNQPKKESDGGFELFWEVYPKKVGKKAAQKAWERASDRPPIDAVLKILRAQCDSEQWRKEHGQFIPNPATWINQGRWSDQVAIPVAPLSVVRKVVL